MELNNNPYAKLEENFNNTLQQNKELLEKQNQLQKEGIQQQVDFNVAELERQKDKVDTNLTKEGQAAYTDYMKANNPFSAQNESLFAQGLGNSGYAETTQSNNFNAYQNRYSNAYQQSVQAKKDFDVEIARAKLTGNLEEAKIAQEKYNQQMQLLWQNQEFIANLTDKQINQKNWQDEFAYQQSQDKLANSNWQQQFDYQKEQDIYQKQQNDLANSQWQQQFDYQKQQDAIQQQNWQTEQDRQQNRWQAEYDLQKKKLIDAQREKAAARARARAKEAAEKEAARQRDLANSKKQEQVNSNYNLSSIANTGLGPLSNKGIEQAVANGKLDYSTNGIGKITFTKNPTPPKRGFTGISDFFKKFRR